MLVMVLISQFRSFLLMCVCVCIICGYWISKYLTLLESRVLVCVRAQESDDDDKHKSKKKRKIGWYWKYAYYSLNTHTHNNIQLLFYFRLRVHTLYAFIGEHKVQFVRRFRFRCRYRCLRLLYYSVWVSMKRKNVDAAGTFTHTQKKVVQLCMFSRKRRQEKGRRRSSSSSSHREESDFSISFKTECGKLLFLTAISQLCVCAFAVWPPLLLLLL